MRSSAPSRKEDPNSQAVQQQEDTRRDTFNDLALELFHLQFARNAAYRKLCEHRVIFPGSLRHWSQIPALPARAFKEFDVTCLSPEARTHVFNSSGTTQQVRSRHYHSRESLDLYESSLWLWFQHRIQGSGFLVPGSGWRDRQLASGCSLLVLTPGVEPAPSSSLVHMFGTIAARLGATGEAFLGRVATDGTWVLPLDPTLAALNRVISRGRPVLILGTAFLFVTLLDWLACRNVKLALPPGSQVLETGGYKGKSRELSREALHACITERLGVWEEDIICEYGMAELGSQAYGEWAGGGTQHMPQLKTFFRFPPWARAQIISPETNTEVAEGEIGLIRVFDLANVYSVLAVQTEDLAVRRGDAFELIGRAPTAEPKGCALMSQDGGS